MLERPADNLPWGKPGLADEPVSRNPSILPLVVRDVTYQPNGEALVQGLEFRLEAGSRTVMLGPNGAGKSLTLRMCHGLVAPTGGELRWAGLDAADASTPQAMAKKWQAMVFQRPVLLRRSALANICHALAWHGVPMRLRKPLAQAALERVGLGALARRQARVLSGGEQQRLALARAWALQPQVLFLDEPTASLDPAAMRAVEDTVNAIHASGTKVVMTTHDLAQARRMADEVLFFHKGRLLEQSPAETFFTQPRTAQARAFLQGELVD